MNHYHDDYPDRDCAELERYRHIRAARTQHRCSCCPDPILPGQPYSRTIYIQDGQFHTFRAHSVCPRDRQEYEQQNHGLFL